MNSRYFPPMLAGLFALGQALNAAEEGPFTVKKNGDN